MKGYYKRAKAYAAVWDEKEARRDFNMVAQLDATLTTLVGRELKALSDRMKEKYWEEKEQYWNMLDKMKDKNEEEDEEEHNKGREGEQEDSESVTTESKDEVKKPEEESPPACTEDQKDELRGSKVTIGKEVCDKEGANASGADQNTSSVTDGKDWQQMLHLVMILQKEGNFYIKEKKFEEACPKLKEALEYVDFLLEKVSLSDFVKV